ncbi:antitoxin Xre/MbcA/ParS toxin-binding domain-containing protein [Arthrobacter livingstonensis]|nr:antitoxin Xre/MbcA/ParS toxin-binding domain-containing protein [Arthrobacter livingstonensis]
MEAEFGFETGHQFAEREGSLSGTSLARERRRQGKLLGIRRRNAIVYPGFQFDGLGKVHPTVIDVLAAARHLNVDDESLAQWFCSPSAALDGLRPVDRLGDRELLLDAFDAGFAVDW